jgi:hypothetical protein
MPPRGGGGGGSWGVAESQTMRKLYTGAQINFGDLTSYCFYFCFTERNSELFSLPRKGSERNSEIFSSAEQPEFRRK